MIENSDLQELLTLPLEEAIQRAYDLGYLEGREVGYSDGCAAQSEADSMSYLFGD